MEIINNILQTTLESFDFAYCIVVNILTYFVISIINDKRGHIDISAWYKRLILVIVIFVTSVLYYFAGQNITTIFNSAILAPVFWTWIWKPICKKFKIDYNDINLFE